jgi:hypothetical protein
VRAGGIIIPDTAKEKPSQAEVIAVGPGGRDESGKLIPIDVKEGDRALFGKWSGTEGQRCVRFTARNRAPASGRLRVRNHLGWGSAARP